MLIASGYQQTLSAQYHRVCNANLGLQLEYNYLNKYYVDFSSAMIHSAKLAKGHRTAFSPSLTLAWRLSKESFLADSPFLDDLILSVSGSIIHQDIDLASGSGDDKKSFIFMSLFGHKMMDMDGTMVHLGNIQFPYEEKIKISIF